MDADGCGMDQGNTALRHLVNTQREHTANLCNKLWIADILNFRSSDALAGARKQKSKPLIPGQLSPLLYLDHVEEHGERLFRLACRENLKGHRCESGRTGDTILYEFQLSENFP